MTALAPPPATAPVSATGAPEAAIAGEQRNAAQPAPAHDAKRRERRADRALNERRITGQRELDADLIEAPGQTQADDDRCAGIGRLRFARKRTGLRRALPDSRQARGQIMCNT